MTRAVELVVLDMAGTTVRDDGAVEAAFSAALEAAGVPADSPEREDADAYVRDTMGQSKIEVFRALFPAAGVAEKANQVFETAFAEQAIEVAAPLPGAEEAIDKVRAQGRRVCLSTGFSAATRDALLERLGWTDLADLTVCPADAGGRGRPFPDMVLTAVLRLGITDVRAVAVAGDTGFDMLSGRRAGASVTAGVLTGAHDEAALRAHGATHVLGSVAELPAVLEG
ncbi:phosphonatase-like hydrolase [Amycolatopsis rubida]|uniref:Phosphonatase-like hydrolase n=1 Tax=Amycolatopsis rubida TaxID=112413 RepID=A0ABX0BWH3_9PSEU|nr:MULTISPECIES: phosphonatase-like hydrolase [Amycolatopsis]MYW94975.1 phosphonatase-like hydrolase [Amycolatopsis rubida]NEC59962.1 phosphonatase-like hydrolase [Amycolatopsis rubida]OAP19997.1 Phosphonoacetaldehyde hydrolase [Amycolatopsis sp. M39]